MLEFGLDGRLQGNLLVESVVMVLGGDGFFVIAMNGICGIIYFDDFSVEGFMRYGIVYAS